MRKPTNTWPGATGRNLKYSLLKHVTVSQGAHFDLVLELQPGRRLWTLKSLSNPFKSDSSELAVYGFIRRRYLHFSGDVGRGRGVVEQVFQGGTYVATSVKDGTLLEFILPNGKKHALMLNSGNKLSLQASPAKRLK